MEAKKGHFHFSATHVRPRIGRSALNDVVAYQRRTRERDLRNRTKVSDIASYMQRAYDLEAAIAEVGYHTILTNGFEATSAELWDAIDQAARCKNGEYKRHAGHLPRLGSFVTASFPYGIGLTAAREALDRFLATMAATYGCALESVIHIKAGLPDHAHILMSDRVVTALGVEKKIRAFNAMAEKIVGGGIVDGDRRLCSAMETMRAAWASEIRRVSGDETIDHRSYRRRGIPYPPVTHVRRGEIEAQARARNAAWRDVRANELAERERFMAQTSIEITLAAPPTSENRKARRARQSQAASRRNARILQAVAPDRSEAFAFGRNIPIRSFLMIAGSTQEPKAETSAISPPSFTAHAVSVEKRFAQKQKQPVPRILIAAAISALPDATERDIRTLLRCPSPGAVIAAFVSFENAKTVGIAAPIQDAAICNQTAMRLKQKRRRTAGRGRLRQGMLAALFADRDWRDSRGSDAEKIDSAIMSGEASGPTGAKVSVAGTGFAAAAGSVDALTQSGTPILIAKSLDPTVTLGDPRSAPERRIGFAVESPKAAADAAAIPVSGATTVRPRSEREEAELREWGSPFYRPDLPSTSRHGTAPAQPSGESMGVVAAQTGPNEALTSGYRQPTAARVSVVGTQDASFPIQRDVANAAKITELSEADGNTVPVARSMQPGARPSAPDSKPTKNPTALVSRGDPSDATSTRPIGQSLEAKGQDSQPKNLERARDRLLASGEPPRVPASTDIKTPAGAQVEMASPGAAIPMNGQTPDAAGMEYRRKVDQEAPASSGRSAMPSPPRVLPVAPQIRILSEESHRDSPPRGSAGIPTPPPIGDQASVVGRGNQNRTVATQKHQRAEVPPAPITGPQKGRAPTQEHTEAGAYYANKVSVSAAGPKAENASCWDKATVGVNERAIHVEQGGPPGQGPVDGADSSILNDVSVKKLAADYAACLHHDHALRRQFLVALSLATEQETAELDALMKERSRELFGPAGPSATSNSNQARGSTALKLAVKNQAEKAGLTVLLTAIGAIEAELKVSRRYKGSGGKKDPKGGDVGR